MPTLMWNLVVLGLVVYLLDGGDADEAVCSVRFSYQSTVYTRQSRSRLMATYTKCGFLWFFTCTEYRTVTEYYAASQTETKYRYRTVCCDGYSSDNDRHECLPIKGLNPEPAADTPPSVSPSVSPSISSSPPSAAPTGPSNVTRNETNDEGEIPTELPEFTDDLVTNLFPGFFSSVATPPLSTGTLAVGGYPKSLQLPQEAMITYAILGIGAVIVVIVIVLGTVRYRRRRRRRLQHEKTDNIHMEPLRDLQLISDSQCTVSSSSKIKHFAPANAPSDEYALVDKIQKRPKNTKKGGAKPKKQLSHSYENTLICDEATPSTDAERKQRRKSPLKFLSKKGKRLTHTYMDTIVISEGAEVNCASAGAANGEDCYSEVDDRGGAKTKTIMEGTKEEEYEAVGAMKGQMDTYDHLDRDVRTGPALDNSNEIERTENGEDVGKYGVLLQCSSDDKEDFDIFLRSVSQTEPGNSGYGTLQHTGDEEPGTCHASHCVSEHTYDDLARGVTFTSRNKDNDLLGLLHQTQNGEPYGSLGRKMSGKGNGKLPGMPDEVGNSEPIYSNQELDSSRPCSTTTDVESTYTDMSGGTIEGARPSICVDEVTYTEMSPVREMSNYFNVSMDVGDPIQEEMTTDQYSSLLDSKQETYDHVERKLDGGKLVTPKGNPKNKVDTSKGKYNVGFIYENV